MRSIRFLALFASLISFQPSYATYSPAQNHSDSSHLVTLESSSKESVSFFKRTKNFLFSLLPSFQASLLPSSVHSEWWALPEAQDPSWAKEWSRLVGHVARENAKQTLILLHAVGYRKSAYESSHGHHLARHKKLVKHLGEEAQQIKKHDGHLLKTLKDTGLGFYLTILAQKAHHYLAFQETSEGREALEEFKDAMARFHQRVEEQKLAQDYFDGDLFEQGTMYAKSLVEISHLERRPENLPRLKQFIQDLYNQLDGGHLSELSRETLDSLKINIGAPPRGAHGFSSRTAGTGMLLLLASSSLIPMASAARPPLLTSFCSTNEFNYGTCETAFAAPLSFSTEIASLKSNSFFQDIITSKIIQISRSNTISDTGSRIGSM